VLSTLCFSLMHACVRHLGTVEGLHPFVTAFWRCLIGGGLLLVWALLRAKPLPGARDVAMIAGRSVLNIAAMLCFYAALALTELTTITALNFTAPLFATLGAWLLLGERLRARRLTALAIGFVGVIVVLRPGLAGDPLGPMLALASSVMWALAMLMIKRMTDTLDSVSIGAYSGLSMAAMALVPTLFVWQWPTLPQWGWLVVTSLVASGAQLALTEAFRRAEASAVMPFDFLKLIWASLLGWLWFAEVPSLAAWIGGAVIFASSVYIAHRERQLRGA
jgi:drug/metabolite transporter (DMT)-like permease